MTSTRLAPQARIAELMGAARELLREVGYERFLPAEVARRCGVSEALVYRYFPTKRDLLSRVAEEWFAEILAVEPELEQVEGTYQRLHYVITYGLRVVRKEPALTRYMFTELRSAPDYRASSAYELNRRFTGIVEQVLREAILAGDFRDDVGLHTLRDMIFGAIEHRTWAFLRDEGDFPLEGTANEITAVIHRGMCTVSDAIEQPRATRPSEGRARSVSEQCGGTSEEHERTTSTVSDAIEQPRATRPSEGRARSVSEQCRGTSEEHERTTSAVREP